MGEIYHLGGELGRGSDGIVRVCRNMSTGREYACKTTSKADALALAHARSELAMLTRLQGHPNVVRVEAQFEDEKELHTVMELCEGGDLSQHLEEKRQEGRVLAEAEAAEAFAAVVKAVCFCHERGIMHRDIKLENLLLPRRCSGYGELKLADFGVAADFADHKVFYEMEGTPSYLAPEVLCRKSYNETADLWSMGVLLYILLCDSTPFRGATALELYRSIHTRKLLLYLNNPWPVFSPHAKELILGLLRVDPCKRMSLSSLLAHPWLPMNQIARPVAGVLSAPCRSTAAAAEPVMLSSSRPSTVVPPTSIRDHVEPRSGDHKPVAAEGLSEAPARPMQRLRPVQEPVISSSPELHAAQEPVRRDESCSGDKPVPCSPSAPAETVVHPTTKTEQSLHETMFSFLRSRVHNYAARLRAE